MDCEDEMKNRIDWIDALRGIGIVLVVFGHVWRGVDNAGLIHSPMLFATIDQVVYLFHMPLFFFLSGLLFEAAVNRHGIKNSFIRRIESLLYPLLLWSYVTAAMLYATGSVTNRSQISLYDALSYPWPPKDIFWFLAALFITQTLASFAAPTHSAKIYFACFIALSIPNLVLDFSQQDIWIRKTVECAPLLFLGMACSRWRFDNRILAGLSLSVFLAAEIIQFFRTSTEGGIHYILSCIAALSFAYAVAWCLQISSASPRAPLAALGRASMAIYLTHVFALAAIRIVLLKLGVHSLPLQVGLGVSVAVLAPYVLYVLSEHFRLLRLLGFGRDRPKTTATQAVSAQS
jgi:fucose 4-O-acetylase-like acetyltransferase